MFLVCVMSIPNTKWSTSLIPIQLNRMTTEYEVRQQKNCLASYFCFFFSPEYHFYVWLVVVVVAVDAAAAAFNRLIAILFNCNSFFSPFIFNYFEMVK